MRADEQVRCHRAARRRLSAVLAARLKSGDRPLSRPVPVGFGQRQAALGAATGVEATPAVDTVAVALVALVHLALGQREAHAALVCHHAALRAPTCTGKRGEDGEELYPRLQDNILLAGWGVLMEWFLKAIRGRPVRRAFP